MARSQRKRPVCQTSFIRVHHGAKSHIHPMAKLKCQQCEDSFSQSDLLSKHATKRHPRENATPIAAVAFSADLNAMPLNIPATRRPAIRIPSSNPTKRSPCENTTTATTITFSADLDALPLHIPAFKRPTTRTPPSITNTKRSAPNLLPRPLAHNILTNANSAWGVTCNPNPAGLPPFDPDTSSTASMDAWLEAFWPGYIGTALREAPGHSAQASTGTDTTHHPSESESDLRRSEGALAPRLN